MKKLLGIVVLSMLLSACNHEKDYPTSLFGVKLLDKVTNYMSSSEWTEVKDKNKDNDIFATRKGKFQKNLMFEDHFMYVNPSTDVIFIVGAQSESGVLNSEFSNTCREKRTKLLSNLKDLKNINERNFKKDYLIEKETNSEGMRSDRYKEVFSLNYEKENYTYNLQIICRYSYADGNHRKYWKNTSIQTLQFLLTAADKKNIVTDKDLVEELNAKILKNIINLKKPLTDEVIKNDFRGL